MAPLRCIAPLPAAGAPALPVSLPNGDVAGVQYATEQVRGGPHPPLPPPVTSGAHFHPEDARRMFPAALLPPVATFSASFGAGGHQRQHNPFQTGNSLSSGFPLQLDGRPSDDRNTGAVYSSSPSLYLPAVRPMDMPLHDSSIRDDGCDRVDVDDRRCSSYSPSTFEHHLVVRPSVVAQSQAAVSGGMLAPSYNDERGGIHAVVGPPTPEPEPALCGDLPLDLTAKTRTDDDDRSPYHRLPAVTTPEATADDVTAYRPRRHYETWKQQGGSLDHPRRDSDSSSDANAPEVGTAAAQLGPEALEMVIDRAPDGEAPTDGPLPVKRIRLSTDEDGERVVTELVATGSPASGAEAGVGGGRYQCSHCEIEFFGSRVLHAMHMAFHGAVDPFQCSQCGVTTADRVEFFLHLARAPHS